MGFLLVLPVCTFILTWIIGLADAQTLNLCTNTVGPRCDCPYNNGKLQVNCKEKQMTFVPVGIQQDAYAVDFSRNAITRIESDDFNGLANLSTLYLQENFIEFLAKGAFAKLYKLKTLNLQQNKLTEIKTNNFVYLPSLVSLDLSSNSIASIERYVIMRLPALGQLSLTNNPLNCDCEMRTFKQALDARMGNLLFQSGNCVSTNIKLTDMKDSQFGTCTVDMFHDLTCMDCKNVKSTEECITQNRTTQCPASQYQRPVCYEEIVYVHSGLIINKGCQTYAQCLDTERYNQDQCYGQSTARCRFCCVGNTCNQKSLRGRLHTSPYLVTAYLRAKLTSELAQPGSGQYTTFVKSVETQVYGILNNQASSYGSFVGTVVDVRGPDLTVDIQIIFTTVEEIASNDREKFIKDQITMLKQLSNYFIDSVSVVLLDQQCNTETTQTDKGIFEWPSVYAGITAVVNCPSNPQQKATRACKTNAAGNAEWQLPDYSSCSSSSSVTQSLQSLSTTSITAINAATVQSDLLALTKQSSTFTDNDVSLSMDVIENVLNEKSVFSNKQMSEDMVESLSNLLNAPDNSMAKNPGKASERFVKSVELLADSIVVPATGFSAVNENLALLVRNSDPNNFAGITMTATVKPGQALTNNKIVIRDGENPGALDSGVVVPASFFNTVQKTSSKFSFAVYGKENIFTNVDTSALQTSTTGKPNQVNGPVISTTLQKADVQNLNQPILFRFKHYDKNSQLPQCAFIRNKGTTGLEWSTQGCSVRNHVPGSHTDCECNHLTSFALLMDIYQTGGGLSEANRLALTYISYIGCGVSLLGLLLTLITYFMFRKLRTNNPSKILINLCIALAITNIIFLIGMQDYTLDNEIGCKIVAVSLHYVLLSALCWMLVEAFYMYLALIKVFNTYFSHFLLKCCLFGWGVPLVVVGVTLGINSTNNYGQQSGGICWLSPIPFYAAFLAPVGIILILNFITFILVFRTIIRGSGKKIAKSDAKTSVSQRLKGAVALIILLGLTWAFAIFAIGDGGIIFQYLFTIFNSLQGLFIFVFNCLLKTDAQNAWKRKFQRGPPAYSGPTISSKDRSSDLRSRDTHSTTYSSEVMDNKKDFTDISKEIDAAYPETRVKNKGKSKRYPSYTESNT